MNFYDVLLAKNLGGGGKPSVNVEPLSITQNGTYTAPSGTAYSPVTVDVSGGGGGDSSRTLAELIERTGTTIEIPQGVTKIGNDAFRNYASLQTVTIPQGLTTIGDNAFYECTNLQDVVLPSSVTDIGTYAFRYCTKLNTITLNSAVPPTLGSMALNNINNFTIYVPSESVEAYKAATNWSSYASKIQAIV